MSRGDDLVFGLCHEVGNLVAAIRLNADLVDANASPVELATASVEIDDSSARIRSWLCLVRPLLDGAYGDLARVSPAGLLGGVRQALEEYGGRGVEIEVASGDGLTAIRGRLDTLHHLIVTLVFNAVEEARPRGHVRVGAEQGEEGVGVFVEDDGPADASLGDEDALTGRGLARASADLILRRFGGRASSVRADGRTRVTLHLPRFDPEGEASGS